MRFVGVAIACAAVLAGAAAAAVPPAQQISFDPFTNLSGQHETAVELKRVPLFSELDRKTLKRVADAMAERTFAAGETVAKEAETGVGFFVIEEGNARVTIDGKDVAQLGPGDHLGEMALIAESPRMATVIAETDIRAHGMTSWEFRRLAENNAALAWKLLESTLKRVQELEQARHAAP